MLRSDPRQGSHCDTAMEQIQCAQLKLLQGITIQQRQRVCRFTQDLAEFSLR